MADKYKYTRTELNTLLRDLRHAYEREDEREFMTILRKLGVKDEHPRFYEVVMFFGDLTSGKT